MTGRVHEIYEVLRAVWRRCLCRRQCGGGCRLCRVGQLVQERYGRGVHGDAALLFLLRAVEVAQPAGKLGAEEPVAAEQAVAQRGLAVINMSEDAEVADVLRLALQRCEVVGGDAQRHYCHLSTGDRREAAAPRAPAAPGSEKWNPSPRPFGIPIRRGNTTLVTYPQLAMIDRDEELASLRERISKLEERNAKVEADKAFESSYIRIAAIGRYHTHAHYNLHV